MLYAVSAVKENVMKSLEIMGYGVLAVFIVIAILIILVKLMQYIEKRIAKNKEKEGYKPLKDKLKEKKLFIFTILPIIIGVTVVIVDTQGAGLLERYFGDFSFMFLFSAALVIGRCLEILAHAVSQRYGLAHIDNLSELVFMHINSRAVREFFQIFFNIKHQYGQSLFLTSLSLSSCANAICLALSSRARSFLLLFFARRTTMVI